MLGRFFEFPASICRREFQTESFNDRLIFSRSDYKSIGNRSSREKRILDRGIICYLFVSEKNIFEASKQQQKFLHYITFLYSTTNFLPNSWQIFLPEFECCFDISVYFIDK